MSGYRRACSRIGDRLKIVAHFHTASKAGWDSTATGAPCFDALPDLRDMLAMLQADG